MDISVLCYSGIAKKEFPGTDVDEIRASRADRGAPIVDFPIDLNGSRFPHGTLEFND